VVNIVQVLTSLQDTTVSTVARLIATGGALFVCMPWMWRHLANFTFSTFSDFHGYLK
jgi:flagellar biosynthetic protein FliQ